MWQRPGEPWSVWWFFPGGEFGRWYGNLEDPFVRWRDGDVCGVDFADNALDVLVEADLSWRWKDEDELATFVARGIIDEALAARVQDEGLRVARCAEQNEPPFDEPWPDWRPDPSWPRAELPDAWEERCR
jgi:hypothetical protein